MISVTVKYYSVYCIAANFCRQEEVKLEYRATLMELITLLAGKYGDKLKNKLFDVNNDLRVTAWVLVNGERVNPDQFPCCLNERDTVIITTPLLVGG